MIVGRTTIARLLKAYQEKTISPDILIPAMKWYIQMLEKDIMDKTHSLEIPRPAISGPQTVQALQAEVNEAFALACQLHDAVQNMSRPPLAIVSAG